MTLDLTGTDHFCGAGGASIGMKAAGVIITDAANHWRPAVDVYNRNNPDTRVHLADLSATDPRRFPRTTLAWFSPECKTHSIGGKGKKRPTPSLLDGTRDGAVERSRVTMEDVIRFTAHHRYEVVMVENVVEVVRWDDTAEGGMCFPQWIAEIVKLGYRFKLVSLNSMVCWPTPQSRDRLYVMFWKVGNPAPDLDIRPRCWCPTCEATVEAYQWWKRPSDDPLRCGKYGPRAQYLYRCSLCNGVTLPWVWPALSALDLSLPTIRIGDRERHGLNPLAPATMRRIAVGLETFGPAAMAQAAGNCYERPGYYRTWPTWQPIKTLTATNQFGLAVRTTQTGSSPRYDATRSAPIEWPLPTQTAQLELGTVVLPMRTHAGPRRAAEPFSPFTTSHGGGHGLVELIDGGKNRRPARPSTEPGPAITATGSHFLVTLRNHGEARPAHEAMGAITAGGDRGGMNHGLLVGAVPFLTHYYGRSGSGSSAAEPLMTQASHDHHALVDPDVDPMDCGFRMLEPPEAKRGMAIPDGYSIDGYSKRTQVALAGHAVTPPASTELSVRAIASLAAVSA